MTTYSAQFIHDLANWQNGWREDPTRKANLASKLLSHRDSIPDVARAVPEHCFRAMLLDKSVIGTLFFNGQLTEIVSSWTTDRSFAESFKDYLPDGKIGFIFRHPPEESEVFLNIPAMWEDQNFQNDLATHKNDGEDFHPALEYFRDENDQKEVILEVTSLNFSDIAGLSGRSSFEGICTLANITNEEEKETLFKACIDQGHFPDDSVCWLTEEGVWMVIDRVIDHLEAVISGTKPSITGLKK